MGLFSVSASAIGVDQARRRSRALHHGAGELHEPRRHPGRLIQPTTTSFAAPSTRPVREGPVGEAESFRAWGFHPTASPNVQRGCPLRLRGERRDGRPARERPFEAHEPHPRRRAGGAPISSNGDTASPSSREVRAGAGPLSVGARAPRWMTHDRRSAWAWDPAGPACRPGIPPSGDGSGDSTLVQPRAVGVMHRVGGRPRPFPRCAHERTRAPRPR